MSNTQARQQLPAGGTARPDPGADPRLPRPPAPCALPDALLDGLERAFRRLRRSIVKPRYAQVPVPSSGRPLALAKVHACSAIYDLSCSGTAVTVKDVAVALHLQHSTVSRLLGEVEAEGLLVREVDPADRRRTTVALTDTGAALVHDAAQVRRDRIRAVLEDWPATDVATLVTLLSRLAESAAARLPTPPEGPCPKRTAGTAGTGEPGQPAPR